MYKSTSVYKSIRRAAWNAQNPAAARLGYRLFARAPRACGCHSENSRACRAIPAKAKAEMGEAARGISPRTAPLKADNPPAPGGAKSIWRNSPRTEQAGAPQLHGLLKAALSFCMTKHLCFNQGACDCCTSSVVFESGRIQIHRNKAERSMMTTMPSVASVLSWI